MQRSIILDETADRQHGLITTRQLRAIGYSEADILQLRRDEQLILVNRGVLRLGTRRETYEQAVHAAILSTRVKAVASHLSAAILHGLWTGTDVHVTIQRRSRATIEGATVHRSTTLDSDEICLIQGIPTTGVARTLLDLGKCLPPTEVARLLDHAVAVGRVAVSELWRLRFRHGHQGRNGVGALERALLELPESSRHAESGPEVAVLRLLLAHGFPEPTPQHEVALAATTFRIDVAYPEERIGIEYDGEEFHSRSWDIAADRRRQQLLEAAGWMILRVRWAELRDGAPLLRRQLRAALDDLAA